MADAGDADMTPPLKLPIEEYDKLAGEAKLDINEAAAMLQKVILAADGGWNSSATKLAIERLAECVFWAHKHW